MNSVKIGDRTVRLLVNAATDAYFEKIFGYSAILFQSGKDKTPDQLVDLYYKLGFVMAMQSYLDPNKMNRLKRTDFIKWVAEFDRGEYLDAIWKIRLIYDGFSNEQIEEYEKKMKEDESNGG